MHSHQVGLLSHPYEGIMVLLEVLEAMLCPSVSFILDSETLFKILCGLLLGITHAVNVYMDDHPKGKLLNLQLLIFEIFIYTYIY